MARKLHVYSSDGLTPYDEVREASMADEGGRSAAIMEAEDGGASAEDVSRLNWKAWTAIGAGIGGLLGVTLLLLRRKSI